MRFIAISILTLAARSAFCADAIAESRRMGFISEMHGRRQLPVSQRPAEPLEASRPRNEAAVEPLVPTRYVVTRDGGGLETSYRLGKYKIWNRWLRDARTGFTEKSIGVTYETK